MRKQPSQPPAETNNGAVDKRGNALPPQPYMMPAFTPSEATAFAALFAGSASDYQQRLVVEWLIWASRHGTLPILPDEKGGMGISHDAMLIIVGQASIGKWMIDLAKWRPKRSATNDEHGLG